MSNTKHTHLDAGRGTPLEAKHLDEMAEKGWKFISCTAFWNRDTQSYCIRYYFEATQVT